MQERKSLGLNAAELALIIKPRLVLERFKVATTFRRRCYNAIRAEWAIQSARVNQIIPIQWCNISLRRSADRFGLPSLVSTIIPKARRWSKET